MRFLADENFPQAAVSALRHQGHDVVWIRTDSPGIADEAVLQRAMEEERVLLTFDKDFGELAWRRGLPSDCGIVLFRVVGSGPDETAAMISAAVQSRQDWPGHFSVISARQVRMRPLPR